MEHTQNNSLQYGATMIMMFEMECKRCGYEWKSRVAEPKECPRCKRRDWDEEREGLKVGGVEYEERVKGAVERVVERVGGGSGAGVCRRCGKEVKVVMGLYVAHQGVGGQMCPGSLEEDGEVEVEVEVEGPAGFEAGVGIIKEMEVVRPAGGGGESGPGGAGVCSVCGEAVGAAAGIVAAHKRKDGQFCEGSLRAVACVEVGGKG